LFSRRGKKFEEKGPEHFPPFPEEGKPRFGVTLPGKVCKREKVAARAFCFVVRKGKKRKRLFHSGGGEERMEDWEAKKKKRCGKETSSFLLRRGGEGKAGFKLARE